MVLRRVLLVDAVLRRLVRMGERMGYTTSKCNLLLAVHPVVTTTIRLNPSNPVRLGICCTKIYRILRVKIRMCAIRLPVACRGRAGTVGLTGQIKLFLMLVTTLRTELYVRPVMGI